MPEASSWIPRAVFWTIEARDARRVAGDSSAAPVSRPPTVSSRLAVPPLATGTRYVCGPRTLDADSLTYVGVAFAGTRLQACEKGSAVTLTMPRGTFESE